MMISTEASSVQLLRPWIWPKKYSQKYMFLQREIPRMSLNCNPSALHASFLERWRRKRRKKVFFVTDSSFCFYQLCWDLRPQILSAPLHTMLHSRKKYKMWRSQHPLLKMELVSLSPFFLLRSFKPVSGDVVLLFLALLLSSSILFFAFFIFMATQHWSKKELSELLVVKS